MRVVLHKPPLNRKKTFADYHKAHGSYTLNCVCVWPSHVASLSWYGVPSSTLAQRSQRQPYVIMQSLQQLWSFIHICCQSVYAKVIKYSPTLLLIFVSIRIKLPDTSSCFPCLCRMLWFWCIHIWYIHRLFKLIMVLRLK